MSLLSFLFAQCFVAGLSLAEFLRSRQPSLIGRTSVRPDRPLQNATRSGYDYARMWWHAQIRKRRSLWRSPGSRSFSIVTTSNM